MRAPSFPKILLFLLFPALLALAGCAAKNRAGLPPGLTGYKAPPPLQDDLSRLLNEGERNWVLNLNRLAVEALRRGETEIARRALDESILQINAVFGPTPGAQKARSVFFSENVKLFKGDPYERSLTFFLRGLLYMQEADWQNARASFRSANFQDAFAEEEQFRSDWTVFDYLIGVCEVQLGRPFYAREAFERAANAYTETRKGYQELAGVALDDAFPVPPVAGDDRLLVVSLMGPAPEKILAGEYGEAREIRRRASGNPEALVSVCEREAAAAPTVDSVYYQASTRGGRPFDKIQGRKVVFKETTGVAGEFLTTGGLFVLAASENRQGQYVGAAALAAGLIAKGLFALARTEADVRQWRGIPDSIGLYPGKGCDGVTELAVQITDHKTARTRIELPPAQADIAVVIAFSGKEPFLVVPPNAAIKGDN